MGLEENKGSGGFTAGFVVGAFCGVLVGVWMETDPEDNFSDKVKVYARKARDASVAFMSETLNRVSEASKEGNRAANRERYSAYLDDWDLNNPNL